jgi:hypothetical protein
MRVELNGVREKLTAAHEEEFELGRALLRQVNVLKAAMRKCDELRRRAEGKAGG